MTIVAALSMTAWGCAKSQEPSGAASGAAPAPAAGAPDGKAAPSARKIVRSAELGVEVTALGPAEAEVVKVVERHGGYVAEASRSVSSEDGQRGAASASFVLRVPEAKLTRALGELKRLSVADTSERVGSEDVTDETIDVQARVENERHLERQLVELLKSTSNVEDSLKVHQELARVRTEIDRLEGRRRFLENEAALATIRLTLVTTRPIVAASFETFRVNVLHAVSDAVDVASAIVLISIRAFGVLLPIALFAAGPILLLRARRRRALAVGD